MRRIRFVPALLVFLLSACNERLIDTQLSKEKGEVVIDLTADERVDIVSVKSGTDSELPDVSEFRIELVNSENVKFYRETYSPETVINLNAGEYTLMAKHGDSLGFGFNAPFYMAKQTFTVEPQKKNVVKAVAKLANVKVAVNYGDQIKADYTDFYTVVHNLKYENAFLKFNDDETRAGYIPGGKLGVKVYATVDGALKAFTLKDNEGNPAEIEVNPNDFITFNVNTGISYGGLVFTILIDNGTELVEKEFEVPYDALSENVPTITLSSFDEEGNYYVTEGVAQEADDVSFTYKAYAGIESCVLDIDCDYMESLGIPTSIDIASQTSEQLAALEEKGFFLAEYASVGVIDIANFVSGIAENADYNGKNTVAGTFTLTLTDKAGITVSETAKILVAPDVSATISINDYDVWATKVVDPIVILVGGATSSAKVQYSLDNTEWVDFMQMTSNPFNMGTVTQLGPNTTYYLRVIYDNWYPISDVISFTTEDDVQLGNAGFEEWTTLKHGYAEDGILSDETKTRDWYGPWGTGEKWWDVNSKKTMPTFTSQQYLEYKIVPTVSWATGNNSTYSAQLVSTYVCNMASATDDGNSFWGDLGGSITGEGVAYYMAAGEIFLGTAATDGSYETEGHAFPSRPTSLTFDYKYNSYKSETFSVKMYLIDADGNIIASKETTATGSDSWSSMTLDFNYSNLKKKASSIRIYFRSSSCADEDIAYRRADVTIAGSEQNSYIGSILTIDNLKLNY